MVLSESIIKGELNQITDYLLRDTNIRDEFIVMIANNTTPEEIFKHNSDNVPVVTDLIFNLISNEKYNNNLAIKEPYQKVLAKLVNDRYDIVLGSLSIDEEDNISLNNFYIFKGYNYQNQLSIKDSTLYSLFNEKVYSLDFNKKYGDNDVTISINTSKREIDITQDKIKVKFDLEAKIVENSANLDLKKEETYQCLNKEFGEIIKQDTTNFIKILQKNKSDILGLQDIYYKKTRKDNHNLWTSAKVEVDVNLKINTKGFIFEVEK